MQQAESRTENAMNSQYTTQAWTTFDRPRLRKIIVMHSNEGTICVRVKILDRETLEHGEARSYWTPATFELVSALLMAEGVIKKVGVDIKLIDHWEIVYG